MSMLGQLMQKVILKRTGYKAMVNGKLINGCYACPNNVEEPGILAGSPVHRCVVEIGTDNKNRILWDPGNIPEWCSFKVIEVNRS